ncbi:protein ripply1 [Tupaia chinensis]|uniref:protein ripply1 n=1 Tax=Tupaia chinensis TaxID=246437 RepID=UPI0003C8E11C|nr:protein ripply1 [Tupaia chinensis]
MDHEPTPPTADFGKFLNLQVSGADVNTKKKTNNVLVIMTSFVFPGRCSPNEEQMGTCEKLCRKSLHHMAQALAQMPHSSLKPVMQYKQMLIFWSYLRMYPAAAAAPDSALALLQGPLALPGLLSSSSLFFSGQEADESGRGACLWRPWLSSTNDPSRLRRKLVDLATGGATAAEATKADSEFHHPVRLFWPKSHSFDYLFSAGEVLLQNFPVQATINLYEDSDSEHEEEEEEEENEDTNEKGPKECVRIPRSTPHRATDPLKNLWILRTGRWYGG